MEEEARLEGKDLWDAARLEALTVYLGPVEKIIAKGAEGLLVLFRVLEDGGQSSRKIAEKARKLEAKGLL